MDEGFIFGSSVNLWDVDENERLRIGIGMCRDSSVVPLYGTYGVENCIVVLIEVVNEDCEQQKLFCLVPNVRYYGSTMGIEVFWPCKCLLMNDEKVAMMKD
jgi:hypothetical protein